MSRCILSMFVRLKKNKSGTTSVQVIDKYTGSYKVVKTIEYSSVLSHNDDLVKQAPSLLDAAKTRYALTILPETITILLNSCASVLIRFN